MQLLGENFNGPFKWNDESLPEASGIYVIAFNDDSSKAQAEYIGSTSNIKYRIRQHYYSSDFDLGPDSIDFYFYYLVFETDQTELMKVFENKLIEHFKPFLNIFSKIHKERELKQKQSIRFSRVTSFTAASIAIIGLSSILFYILNTNKVDKNQSTNVKSLIESMEGISEIVNSNQSHIKDLNSRFSGLIATWDKVLGSTTEEELNVLVAISNMQEEVNELDSTIETLNNILITDPYKAVSIPLLYKDLEKLETSYKTEYNYLKDLVEKSREQNKWLTGIAITILLSLLSMAIGLFNRSKTKKAPVVSEAPLTWENIK